MAIVFGNASSKSSKRQPVLASVFQSNCVVTDETDGDSPPNSGGLRVITNYRGHTKDKAGRKAALCGQTVLDLGAIGTCIPLGELDDLIERLTAFRDELAEEGVLGGKGDPDLSDM